MMNRNLEEQTAILLGWSVHRDENGEAISYRTGNDKILFAIEEDGVESWNPCNNLKQAFEIVESLRKENLFLDIKCDTSGYWISIYKDGTHHEFKNIVSLNELPKEICQKAILAKNGISMNSPLFSSSLDESNRSEIGHG